MRIRPALLTVLLAAPWAALAHVGADGSAHAHVGFSDGLAHPFTGLDHLAAMLAVGVWSALTARQPRDMAAAPLAFAAMLLAGALAGLAGVALPAVEPMIAASLLVLGLLVLARLRLPAPVAAVLVGAFAAFHGVAHGVELAGETGGAAALAGMVLATAVLHGAGLALGWALRTRYSWGPRIAGAAVAVFGAAMLAQVV
ncbi:HupE/UreJ family protein [Pseudorhodoferax sp. Leaf267]|uniref:HupE/UreJ family protein n=1 Tax=Pseudorhodoferax sp. Leaf267 TaxID=1736316 RepID=UPI0006FFE149|nr:HupE/UreJ family protein [Pseudorhodoferax sp. Leaf267]KQP18004.1 urease accessory protein UreJ [Pseudorhodoferax sp. Leaf267]